MKASFEWDEQKNQHNILKHSVSFKTAQHAFLDPKRIIAKDISHSEKEDRYYCFGAVKEGILTVRFTYRTTAIRIFGAGYWRKGKAIYEKSH